METVRWKNNSVCGSYQTQLMGWKHSIYTQIIHSYIDVRQQKTKNILNIFQEGSVFIFDDFQVENAASHKYVVQKFKPGVYNLLLLAAGIITAATEFKLYWWDTAKCQPTQNTFKHKLRIHSITLCDITIQIVTHRNDWFSCLPFVLLQYMPAWPPNLIF